MQHFTDFKTELEAEGISPSTINKHLSYISKILKWAAANVRSEELPFRVPRYSRKKTTPDPVKPLTRRQVNEIYKHIQPPYQFIFLLMADMGLRRQEAMTVKIQDIDERFKAINIRGKGSKIRRIPFMTDRFEQAALSVLELKIDGYATVNPETEKPYLNIRKELIRAGKAAGIKRKVGHHLLRHSFATWCAEEGMNPHALQRIMGHSSIETTNKIYTHVGSDFIGKEVMRMREKKNEKKIKKPHLYVVKN
ncbi:tyrosine-type recombinase/integrase [Desulforhopalus singaporensis]|nr:site-specific integrase [Desulforhopalus singaporensis]